MTNKKGKKKERWIWELITVRNSNSFSKSLLLPPVSLIKISHQGGEKKIFKT